MKNKVDLLPLENFDEVFKSLKANFAEKFTEAFKDDSAWIYSKDGKHEFRVKILSITLSDENEDFENYGQLKFLAQLLEQRKSGEKYGTLFGFPALGRPGRNPFFTGYLTTQIGSRKSFFETDRQLSL
ncbi:MAG: hypothetical protein NT068_00715 [Candidatus Nomurabacteria bacterium]|nr:hypothetical protein [Candidatus Nomurabacteria bacterium]